MFAILWENIKIMNTGKIGWPKKKNSFNGKKKMHNYGMNIRAKRLLLYRKKHFKQHWLIFVDLH